MTFDTVRDDTVGDAQTSLSPSLSVIIRSWMLLTD